MKDQITNPKDSNRREPNIEYPIVALGKVNVELFKVGSSIIYFILTYFIFRFL